MLVGGGTGVWAHVLSVGHNWKEEGGGCLSVSECGERRESRAAPCRCSQRDGVSSCCCSAVGTVCFCFCAYLICFFFKSSSCSILYVLFVAIKHTCFEITLCNMAHT